MNISSFSKNGVITPIQEALIPLDNLEYAYGYGVYETLKVRKGKLFFVKEHVERLFLSCQLIDLEHIFSREQIEKYIQELVTALGIDACNIKMMLIGGKTAADATLYIFATAPLYPDRKLYKHGAKTKTFSYERWLPNAKSLNMLPSYLIYKKALTADCYDGLLIDRDGYIREGTRTNFFCIKGMEIISPPTEKILEGVTRKTIVSVLQNNGFSFTERDIPLADISKYDGAFLTSTSTKIIPIKQIDEYVYPEIPENLRKLMKIYDIFLDELMTVA